MSEKQKKEIDEFWEIVKGMNPEELTATKFFGLGVVAARDMTDQENNKEER